jgi:hypothetical protein
MRFLHTVAAWFLSWLSHVPVINKTIGDFDFGVFALLLILSGISLYWAVTRWGKIEPTEGKKFFGRMATGLKNFRARVFLAFGSLVMVLVFLGVFAAGMLGTGSRLNLNGGPLVLGTHKVMLIAYAERDVIGDTKGWDVLVQPQSDDGRGFNKSQSWYIFIPDRNITDGVEIKTGGKMALVIVHNEYFATAPIPT